MSSRSAFNCTDCIHYLNDVAVEDVLIDDYHAYFPR
jgi:hypothetical protein